MGNVIDVNGTTFQTEVLESKLPVVVDFGALWCGPCRKLSPILDEISITYEEKIKFVKVNVEADMEIAKKYSVSSLPTILIFNNGESVERMAGMMPKSAIISNIEKYL